MTQFCCGSGDCGQAGVGTKKIRGMDFRRDSVITGGLLRDTDGNYLTPVEIGNPIVPRALTDNREALSRRGKEKCKYSPNGDLYTRPGWDVEILLTSVEGGTGGAEVTISQERTVGWSTTFEAGLDVEIFSASVSVTFEESITDSKEKKFTIPAGQAGKLGFTPTLKCTQGSFSFPFTF